MKKTYTLAWDRYTLELGPKTRIMGILNVTPDSFSDGGDFFSVEAAVAHGERLVRDGADILDVGGESTRPFSDPVSIQEEIGRVVPVIERLAPRIDVPISIDTTKAEVARAAIAAGAAMVNDVGALRMDPELAGVVARCGVPVIVMHMLGTPKTMQVAPVYHDLVPQVRCFLRDAVLRAVAAGIPKSHVIVDPGIGFGKTVDHNLCLIRRLDALGPLDAPILVGPSRKAFIRNLLKGGRAESLACHLPEVETGTQAVVAAAALNGAHIVRVHNVANTRSTITLVDAIRNAPDGYPLGSQNPSRANNARRC